MTTELEKKLSLEALRREAAVLQECLRWMQVKARVLMENNITGLERILVEEAKVLERLQRECALGGKSPIQLGDAEHSEWVSLRRGIAALAREMQCANETNARLVQSGLRFCGVLYSVLCPPQTYSPELEVLPRAVEATFQAQY